MSEHLTPEEVEQTLKAMGESWFSKAEVATLRAYAKVVEAVAKAEVFDLDDTCVFCKQYLGAERPEHMTGGHASDCAYPLARELRGHVDS